MSKKLFLGLISFAMLLSVFAGFGGNKASASTNEEVLILDSAIKELEFIKIEKPVIDDSEIQPNSIPSIAVKEALKWAVKNTTKITNYIGKYFGDDMAVKVGNVMHDHVKPTLQKLENAQNLTYDKVESTLREALEKPFNDTVARIAASVIVEAIKFLAPI